MLDYRHISEVAAALVKKTCGPQACSQNIGNEGVHVLMRQLVFQCWKWSGDNYLLQLRSRFTLRKARDGLCHAEAGRRLRIEGLYQRELRQAGS